MSSQPSNRDLIINSSANELDELFKAVIGPKDSQIPLSVPMRQRNFPASFFKPPDGAVSASHSRESSLDASFSPPLSQPSGSPLSPASPQQQTLQLNGVPSGLTINHPRAHSSPATLQQTLAVSQAMASAQQSVHLRQFSYDIGHLPLPDGWEESKTPNGERYFINHKDKTTTWEDPRRKLLSQQMQQQLRQQTQPRLVLINQSNNSNANNSSNAMNNTNSSSTGNLSVAVGPLPEGWEQSRTPSGEVYFINHADCSTQWWDPRLPIAAQQQSRAQLRNGRTPPPPFTGNTVGSTVPSSLVVALQNMNTSGSNPTADALQQQHQRTVLNLELERQKLRQRQHEILRQNFRPSSLVDDNRLPPISSTTGIDPFLGGNNGPLNNDCHSRQESADSGLGLGSNYSLPNTPEDFLSIEDTISSADDSNNNMSRSGANDLGLDSLQVANLDLGTENMESDDLVPSLPDDFNADLLSNVEALLDTNRDNIMTWL